MTFSLSEQMWWCKYLPHLCKMPTLTYNRPNTFIFKNTNEKLTVWAKICCVLGYQFCFFLRIFQMFWQCGIRGFSLYCYVRTNRIMLIEFYTFWCKLVNFWGIEGHQGITFLCNSAHSGRPLQNQGLSLQLDPSPHFDIPGGQSLSIKIDNVMCIISFSRYQYNKSSMLVVWITCTIWWFYSISHLSLRVNLLISYI
jgi:hypothetical protein